MTWITDVIHVCPQCNGPLDVYTVTEYRGDDDYEHEYEDAERCPACRWQVNYGAGDESPAVVAYGTPVPTEGG